MEKNKRRTPDFSGWATVYGKLCGDGRTIKHGAFKAMDGEEVPLMYQHQHNDPEMIVGSALLHAMPEGIWTDCYFNDGPKTPAARAAVDHEDLKSLSIWANNLTENARHEVSHGVIREVSLVLAGANTAARIDYHSLHHSGISCEEMYSDAVIYNGIEFEYGDDIQHAEPEEAEDMAAKYGIESSQDLIDAYSKLSPEDMDLMNLGLAMCGGAKVDDATVDAIAKMIDSKEESVKVKLLTMLTIASGAGDDDEEPTNQNE